MTEDENSEHLSASPCSTQGESPASTSRGGYPTAEQAERCDSPFTRSGHSSDPDSLPSSPSSQGVRYPENIEEFWNCGLRGEWAFGEFVPMPPPSSLHEDRAFYVVYLFWTFLQALDHNLDYKPEYRVDYKSNSGMHHRWCDVMYLELGKPIIAFEIVSSTETARIVDLVDKKGEYARSSIPTFVLVDGEDEDAPKVIIHSDLKGGQYTTTKKFTGAEIVTGHELLEKLQVKAQDYLTPAMTRKKYMELSTEHANQVNELDRRMKEAEKKVSEANAAVEEANKRAAGAEAKAKSSEKKVSEVNAAVEEANKRAAGAEAKANASDKRAADAEAKANASDKRAADAEAKANASEKRAAAAEAELRELKKRLKM